MKTLIGALECCKLFSHNQVTPMGRLVRVALDADKTGTMHIKSSLSEELLNAPSSRVTLYDYSRKTYTMGMHGALPFVIPSCRRYYVVSYLAPCVSSQGLLSHYVRTKIISPSSLLNGGKQRGQQSSLSEMTLKTSYILSSALVNVLLPQSTQPQRKEK